MANYKTFIVTSEIKVHRGIWREIGYGDQPSKAEVHEVFDTYAKKYYLPGSETRVAYLGAPGHYRVTQKIRGTEPWWRRLGFGASAAKREVQDEWTVTFSKYVNYLQVDVQIG